MPVDPSTLDKTMADIRQLFSTDARREGGTGIPIMMGSDEPVLQRIPTGSHMLNWALNGGIPVGRWSRMYGGFSSGKTLTTYRVIANAQAMGMTCAYYNIEKRYDPVFARACGVDTDKLVLVPGSIMENIGTKLESLLKSVHLHVLDSCSSATSIEELQADIRDWQMGLKARVWGKIFYKVLERFDERENCIIIIDQIRDVFNSGTVAPPGGRFIEHAVSTAMYFRKSSWLFLNEHGELRDDGGAVGVSGDTEPDGIEFMVRVEKNTAGRPLRVARMRYAFGGVDLDGVEHPGQLDELYELAQLGTHFGAFQKTTPKSSYYERCDGQPFADGSMSKQGLPKLRGALAEDPALKDLVVASYERYYTGRKAA